MVQYVYDYSQPRVREMLKAGEKMGLKLSMFPELGLSMMQAFKAMEYVIAKARRRGVRLLLSLVNSLHSYGGKTQYVEWIWQDDDGAFAVPAQGLLREKKNKSKSQ
ncbi:hypothetical protein PIB30_045376 [Stylosanthes scabra]|uniref:Uncharacterized protein n=1 Tax=Stylosanthes scabra TaxID=79078 RepID=A0ABU6TI04_9FABA|nr:hypothetical protein [Stylosanthes scabra]